MEVVGVRDELVALAAAVSRRVSCLTRADYAGAIAFEAPRLDVTTQRLFLSIRAALLRLAAAFFDVSGTADPRLGVLAAPQTFAAAPAQLLDPSAPHTLARLPELYAPRVSDVSQQLVSDWVGAAWHWLDRFRYTRAQNAMQTGLLVYTRAADGTTSESTQARTRAFGELYGGWRQATFERRDGPESPTDLYGPATNIWADDTPVRGATASTDTTSTSFGIGAYAENPTRREAQLVVLPYLGAPPAREEYARALVGSAATGAPRAIDPAVWYQPGGYDDTRENLEYFAGRFLRVRLRETQIRQSTTAPLMMDASEDDTPTYYTQQGARATTGTTGTTTTADVGYYYTTPRDEDGSIWTAFDGFGVFQAGGLLTVGTVPAHGTFRDDQFLAAAISREPTAFPSGFFAPGPALDAPVPAIAVSGRKFTGNYRLAAFLDFGPLPRPQHQTTQP